MNLNTQIRTVGRKYQNKQGKENYATIYIGQKWGEARKYFVVRYWNWGSPPRFALLHLHKPLDKKKPYLYVNFQLFL